MTAVEDDEDYLVALTLAQLALAYNRRIAVCASKKWGPRGPYDHVKSEDFFDLLLHKFTDRQFKNWLRCDSFPW
jgi:hypothetical protein